MKNDGQIALDIDALIHQAEVDAAPPWDGAPLGFTTDYYPPAELDAAFAHWRFLNGGYDSFALSRMWHRAIAVPGGVVVDDHTFDLFTADLRCRHDASPDRRCACVGDLAHQAVCEPCKWHQITYDENAAVESWHDHAVVGWRDLPIVPATIQLSNDKGLTGSALAWIDEYYPTHMRFPGAPIITERPRLGTRHVPGRSPWGGYDLSQTALPLERRLSSEPTPRRRPRRTISSPAAEPYDNSPDGGITQTRRQDLSN